MALRIEDYALVGDTHTGALIGRDGSVDWLCMPRFDSPACFAALLGGEEAGFWRIHPAGEVKESARRYRGDTMVLETTFETADGRVRVIDFMPVRGERADLIRMVEGLEGRVPMVMELKLRFDYGRTVPWAQREGSHLSLVAGPNAVVVRTPVDLRGADHCTLSEFDVAEGDSIPFSLAWHDSTCRAPDPLEPQEALEETERYWHDWASQCTYEGDYRNEVVRSLLTLKTMTFAPTGGLLAALTTSLPEQLGGPRNWDYRYCWLRDSTLTLQALMRAGYEAEAAAWDDWLLRAVAGSAEQLQMLYGLDGRRHLPEIELLWLEGYESSRPVRIGNAATDQFQLDVYGEVMDTLHLAMEHDIEWHKHAWNVQLELMRFLESAWREPDEGIWEVRGPRRHFTHSKVMAWVAFDRALRSVERHGVEGPVDRWRKIRDEIHREVCEQGYDKERGTFTQYYGSDELDAAVLMIPIVGFLPAHDDRMVSTVESIRRHLCKDGFVHRYTTSEAVDGLPGGEATFLPCTFWLVDNLVLLDRHEEAAALFQKAIGAANDVGLLSEEYDPHDDRLLGNFPQALSHLALVISAMNLTQADAPASERGGTK